MADLKNRIQDMGDKTKDFTRKAGEKAEETTSGVMGTVKETVQNIAEGASSLAGQARDTAQSWASTASDVASQAGERVQAMASGAAETAGDVGEELTRLIRRYPIPALLVGFGVGFLMAQAMRSMSD